MRTKSTLLDLNSESKKLRNFFFLLSVFILACKSNAQTFQWAKSWGASFTESATGVATDAAGNIYLTGPFTQTVDFDPGPGTFTMSGSGDVFITKLDPSGNLVWAKKVGGPAFDYCNDIAVDAAGNSYITGYFNGTADFNPGTATNNLVTTGSNDVFICKLDVNGNYVWAKSFTGSGSDGGNAIAVDNLGNVYTTGFFAFTPDFDPGAGSYPLSSTGGPDVFVSKLDANGNFVWARSFGSSASGIGTDFGNSIAVDVSGNVYTTGTYKGTADFDPGAGTYTLATGSNFNEDAFVSKLDASGNFVWAVSYTGPNSDAGRGIHCDASGNVYTVGNFSGFVDFDPAVTTYTMFGDGMSDGYVTKLSSAGNFMWTKKVGGTGSDGVEEVFADATGNINLTGFFEGTVDFDPNAAVFNLVTPSSSNKDPFVSVLDASGNFLNAFSFSGTGTLEEGMSVCVDFAGSIIASGYFTIVSDFDPSAGTYTLSSSNNYEDAYVVKLGPVVANVKQTVKKDVVTKIYPNPFHNEVTIELKGINNPEQIEVKLFNLLGQEIEVNKTIDESKVILQRGDLLQGIYFYKVISEGAEVGSGKLIAE
jgi:hypothetical protein